MPGRRESPLFQLDLLLAHPFLTVMQEDREAPPPAACPDMLSPHAAGSRGPKVRRALAWLSQAYAALRRDVVSLLASEPAPFEDEVETVLMFSLTGLAFSLYLAAEIHMTGADDGLADILMLLS
jgi:hypothetical protein